MARYVNKGPREVYAYVGNEKVCLTPGDTIELSQSEYIRSYPGSLALTLADGVEVLGETEANAVPPEPTVDQVDVEVIADAVAEITEDAAGAVEVTANAVAEIAEDAVDAVEAPADTADTTEATDVTQPKATRKPRKPATE